MKTKFLLLWFEAPLQAWGFDSKFGRRDSLPFPTKSGVLGLILCAMGASGEQKELLAKFRDLTQTVISYKKIKLIQTGDNGEQKEVPFNNEPLLKDFHMIGSGYNDKDSWENLHIPKTSEGGKAVGGGSKITYRFYLQDAVFAVALEIPEDQSDEIIEALQNPVYDLYLGRKSCVPTEFVYQGIFETENEALIAAQQKAYSKKSETQKLEIDFYVYDGNRTDIDFDNADDVFTLNDTPIQFGQIKKYADRQVAIIREGNYENKEP